MEDFISPPWRVRVNIEGYSGSTSATHIGTVRWRIDDDLGQPHDILLPNTYYSSHGKHRLLCLQHWAQTAKDNHPHPNGTWCATYANYVVLHWNQQQYRHTVKLLPHTNVGVIRTAPGIQQYAQTCTLLEHRLGARYACYYRPGTHRQRDTG
jgi:alkylated DNA repair dioxygenase AlkB